MRKSMYLFMIIVLCAVLAALVWLRSAKNIAGTRRSAIRTHAASSVQQPQRPLLTPVTNTLARRSEAHEDDATPVYNGPVDDSMFLFYLTNLIPAHHLSQYTQHVAHVSGTAFESFSNVFWLALHSGVRPPTNIIDFVRFCVDACAIDSNSLSLACMLEFEAESACYLKVWRAKMCEYYVADYELSTATVMPWAASVCRKLLLYHQAELQQDGYERIPSLTAVTNHNELYRFIMRDKRPETTPKYAVLDPARYPREAHEWALNFPDPYTRYQQQSAWQGPRGTGLVAIAVLNDIVRSWDRDPPPFWKNNPALAAYARRHMRMIIEENRRMLAEEDKQDR